MRERESARARAPHIPRFAKQTGVSCVLSAHVWRVAAANVCLCVFIIDAIQLFEKLQQQHNCRVQPERLRPAACDLWRSSRPGLFAPLVLFVLLRAADEFNKQTPQGEKMKSPATACVINYMLSAFICIDWYSGELLGRLSDYIINELINAVGGVSLCPLCEI
jgi:hypothetical protein